MKESFHVNTEKANESLANYEMKKNENVAIKGDIFYPTSTKNSSRFSPYSA